MKYYAVTDDINELYHYGVKGMKWGQHLFGDDLKPKSPGYKRAANKLRSIAKSIRKDVEVRSNNRQIARTNKAYARSALSQQKYANDLRNIAFKASSSQPSRFYKIDKETKRQQRLAKEQNRYQRQLLKAQARSELSKFKYGVDQELSGTSVFDRAYATSKVGDSIRKAKKFTQQAREGRLRYKNLSDNQINRLTERLALEQQSRRLGNTEKPSFWKRKREAIREGKLEGYKRGTAAGMEEVGRALAVYGIKGFMNRKKLTSKNKFDAERQREANRIRNKKSKHDLRKELEQEQTEMDLRLNSRVGKKLTKLENQQHELLRQRDMQDKLSNERDEMYNRILNINGTNNRQAIADQQEELMGTNTGLTRYIPGHKKRHTAESKAFKKMSESQKQQYIIEKQKEKAYKEVQEYDEKESMHREQENQYKKDQAQYIKDKEKFDKDTVEYPKLLAKQEKDWEDHKAAIDAENKRLNDDYNDQLKVYNDAWDNYNTEMRDYQSRLAANRLQGFAGGAGPVPKKPTILKPTPPALRSYGKKPDPIKPPVEPIPPKLPDALNPVSYASRTIYDQMTRGNGQGQGKGKGKGKKN